MVLYKFALLTVELNQGNLCQDYGVGRFKIRIRVLKFVGGRLPNKGNSIMQNTICLKLGWTYFLSHELGRSLTGNSSPIGICLEFLDFRP